jgi:hypothetical protein
MQRRNEGKTDVESGFLKQERSTQDAAQNEIGAGHT